jgi:hypothetical protein
MFMYNGGIIWEKQMLEDNTKMKHLKNTIVRRSVIRTSPNVNRAVRKGIHKRMVRFQ